MTTMDQYRDKFQRLLRELFQFDCSDLDFGIYRIMNYKRDVIEKFISTDLPKAIADELDRGALADQSHAAAELTETSNQIVETLGRDALDADAKGDDTIEKVVDLPETFNYLLGLHVSTRKVYDDDGRRYLVYQGRIDHRRITVIWRETEGWGKKDLERDKKFVAKQKLAEGADEVFVNGDSFIPNAKALEPMFKARMFSTVEA
jgi:hypothetical protein